MAPSGPAVEARGLEVGQVRPARRALAGFFLVGLILSFLGAILPAWGYHLTEAFSTVGLHFLALYAGMVASSVVMVRLLPAKGIAFALVLACGLATAAFLFLAAVPVTADAWWRMAGVLGLGFAGGTLNASVFHAISPLYRRDRAATVNLAGAFFGLGCLVASLLVAGTFYVYTVPSILILMALLPGFLIPFFVRSSFPPDAVFAQPPLGQAAKNFKSPGAILFSLLLFFQFGNEWSIAGWLPLFLVYRLGVSPETSLWLLALYWLALLVGRMGVQAVLPRVRHGRLLIGSALGAMLGCGVLMATNNMFGAASGVLLVGLGFAAIYPLVVEKIGGRFSYYHPGFFNGIFSFALTGGLLAPASLGLFAGWWGVRVIMALPLAGTLVVVLLLLLIWIETRLTGTAELSSRG